MKLKIDKVLFIIFPMLLIIFSIFTTSKYATCITQEGKGIIAEPIIILESFEGEENLVNKLDFPKTYDFKIKNYNEEKINEVEFSYNIELETSDTSFPVKYKLIDLSENKVIELNNNKSGNLKISKNIKEDKTYRIFIDWENKNIKLDEKFFIKVKLNINQYKIGDSVISE